MWPWTAHCSKCDEPHFKWYPPEPWRSGGWWGHIVFTGGHDGHEIALEFGRRRR